jgi:DNA transposition AAA+ family ATPase
MGPIVTFLVKIDRETWRAFTERRMAEGRTAIGAIRLLIQQYAKHGFIEPKDKDTK